MEAQLYSYFWPNCLADISKITQKDIAYALSYALSFLSFLSLFFLYFHECVLVAVQSFVERIIVPRRLV